MTPEQMRSYFDLQLRFAEAMAVVDNVSMAQSVTRNTNIHRRFGLGTFQDNAPAPLWSDCMAAVEQAASHHTRLDAVCECLARAPTESLPDSQIAFGCFSLERQPERGAVRLHFGNRLDNPPGRGPLHASRREERLKELRALFAYVRNHCADAQTVRGGSWLYHVEAYQRLFPPSFIASRCEAAGNRNFAGTSSWGQFLDHQGDIKTRLAARFLENLTSIDPEHPGRAFPMPALRTQAPVEDFFVFYAV
jgi:hypothetical protein